MLLRVSRLDGAAISGTMLSDLHRKGWIGQGNCSAGSLHSVDRDGGHLNAVQMRSSGGRRRESRERDGDAIVIPSILNMDQKNQRFPWQYAMSALRVVARVLKRCGICTGFIVQLPV